MSLEQSIDRLSTLIEQLIKQLELGRQGSAPAAQEAKPGKSAPTQTATQTATQTSGGSATATNTGSPSEGESSSGTTKSTEAAAPAPAASGASTGLDYMADIAPIFQKLVQADRAAAVALIAKLKPGAKKMSEAVEGHDLADVRAQINAMLGG